MRFRYLALSTLVFLSACNNENEVSEATFEAPVIAKPVTAVTPVFPEDFVLKDANTYDGSPDAGLDLVAINEVPGRKHHTMTIKGKEVGFTASAGHIIAYAPKDAKNPSKKDAQAAIFYAAYTRDDLPKDKRPVTFFFNGGPGSSTIWLHMGSWAPKRVHIDSPVIPAKYVKEPPKTLPLIDNEETLLDQSDLVFVDALGTGYSQAIKPHKNEEFWGVGEDAKLFRDFITSYNNKFNRQSSPKYIYGESYGGIRGPILANLLQNAGTTSFEPDPSGKPPVVLSGLILNSPILDYGSTCDVAPEQSCAGFLPTYGMVADFHGRSTVRGTASVADYAETLRRFAYDGFSSLFPEWTKISSATSGLKSKIIYIEWLADYFDATSTSVDERSGFASDIADEVGAPDSFIEEFVADPVAALRGLVGIRTEQMKVALGPWLKVASAKNGAEIINELAKKTGIASSILVYDYNISPRTFSSLVLPDHNLGRYDARIKLPLEDSYSPDDYEAGAFISGLKTLLPDFLNYHNGSEYLAYRITLMVVGTGVTMIPPIQAAFPIWWKS